MPTVGRNRHVTLGRPSGSVATEGPETIAVPRGDPSARRSGRLGGPGIIGRVPRQTDRRLVDPANLDPERPHLDEPS